MQILSGLNLEEIQKITDELGASKFRARQIHNWIYLKSVKLIDEMTDLSVKFREQLKEVAEISDTKWNSLDCENSRILTSKGIYSCPFLANDHRGRCGSSFLDYSDKTVLESSCCQTCIKNKNAMFAIEFKK